MYTAKNWLWGVRNGMVEISVSQKQVYSGKPLLLSHLPHAHKLEGKSFWEMAIAGLAGHPATVLFSATHTVSKVKVLRALDQEMGEARGRGHEDRSSWNECFFPRRLGTMMLGWTWFSGCSWWPPWLQRSVGWGWRGAWQSSGTDARERKSRKGLILYHSYLAAVLRQQG